MRRRSLNLRALLLALLGMVLLAVLGVLVYQSIFVVRNVMIQGETSVSDEEIIRTARIDLGGSIRAVDEDELRENLQGLGKLALERVSVEYPDTVILTVRERSRDAMALNGGRILVMDSDGYVIEVCDSMPDDAGIYVTGLDGASYRVGSRYTASEARLEAMRIVIEALKEQNAMEYASELNVSDVMKLWVTTRTGIRVELGDVESMSDKALWMKSAVADLESRGETKGTLDISSGSKADYMP